MPDKKSVSEEKTASASYVLGFFQNVLQFNHWYANYENIVLELQTKYKLAGNESPEDKETLKGYCQTIRYYSTQCYVSYCAIIQGLKRNKSPEIEQVYEKILSILILERKDVREFAVLMNSFIMENIIKDLLQSSNDLVNKLYGQSENAD